MRSLTRGAATLVAALVIAGCASTDATSSAVGEAGTDTGSSAVTQGAESTGGDAGTTTSDALAAAMAENQASHLDVDDLEYDESQVVEISLDGTSASTDAGDVTVEGASVTITAAGVYALSGTLTDGEVIVDAADTDDVTLILDGVDITHADGAAIAVMNADESVVLLADGSTNRLADGADYVFPDDDTDEPNATLYSTVDLAITGDGSLVVDAAYNDGIGAKDGLVIAGGTIDVTAVDDAIRGKDYVIVDGGDVTVEAGGDGLKADNADDIDRGYVLLVDGDVDVTSGDDGVQAATDVLVAGGRLTVDAGSASDSGRGVQGDVMVVVSGGVIDVTAVDDAIHANDHVTIEGGDMVLASGDDGVHGDLAVTIDGGSTTITEAFEGIESEVITINDGAIDITSDDDGLNVASADAAATAAVSAGEGVTDDAAGAPGGGGPGGGGPGGGGPGGGDTAVGDHYVYINGGTTVITITDALAEQGDGIDANGHVEMSGGVVAVSGPTDTRNSAVDYSGGSFVMTGGTFIGTNVDGRNSEGIGTGSTQASIYLTAGSTIEAGTVVHVETTDGEGLVTFEPVNDYSVVVFSSPELVDGESYDVYLGGSVTGDATTHLYDDAAYAAGELAGTVTASTTD